MHKCPHCEALAVSDAAVRWSGRSSAAKCASCNKLSHVLASTSSGIFSVCVVLLCITAIFGVAAESYLIALSGLCVTVVYDLWAWRQVELFPISPASAKVAAQVSWWLLLLSLFAEMFS